MNTYIHTYIHTYIQTDRQTALAFNTLIWGSLRLVPTKIIGLINCTYTCTHNMRHTQHMVIRIGGTRVIISCYIIEKSLIET